MDVDQIIEKHEYIYFILEGFERKMYSSGAENHNSKRKEGQSHSMLKLGSLISLLRVRGGYLPHWVEGELDPRASHCTF
jgi:hypothetical protein